MRNLFDLVFKKYKCYATAAFLLINLVVFLRMFLKNPEFDTMYMYDCGAMTPDSLGNGDYYRLVTSMFLHFDLQHLGNNMLMLAAIGSTTEHYMGTCAFSLVYLLGGIAGNVFSAWNYTRMGENVVAAGASGAVFAVIGGLLCLVLIHKGRLENFTTRKVVVFIVLILYQGFTTENVDNYAHAGGLAAGFIIGMACMALRHKLIEGNDDGHEN